MVNFGDNFYGGKLVGRNGISEATTVDKSQLSLMTFLDFAVGAAECCEILHHGVQAVHGELRGDAFHFNIETGTVKMVNFGSGARSFENGLTSAGWASLLKERGVEHKLQFIAPEQTGRMSAEPDTRTDIYSLGILLWTMLAGEPVFNGSTPLEIMQNVLSRRVTPVSSKRVDIPIVLSSIIQRMTQKNIDDRYHSTSGLRYDLSQVRKLLYDGDGDGLKDFQIGTRDISCFFNLPSHQIGRQKEKRTITDIIEKTVRRLDRGGSKKSFYSLSSTSSVSDTRIDSGSHLDDMDSEGSTSNNGDLRLSHENESVTTNETTVPHRPQTNVIQSTSSAADEVGDHKYSSRSQPSSKSFVSGQESDNHRSSSRSFDSASGSHQTRSRAQPRTRCEVISISGAAGLGKTSLVESVHAVARGHGYVASAKFDQAQGGPFDPILRLMSSLFRQIFSESDVSTEFHNTVRAYSKPGKLKLPSRIIVGTQSPATSLQLQV